MQLYNNQDNLIIQKDVELIVQFEKMPNQSIKMQYATDINHGDININIEHALEAFMYAAFSKEQSTIYYLPETSRYEVTSSHRSIDVNGLFMGYIPGDNGDKYIITNIKNPDIYIGACSALMSQLNSEIGVIGKYYLSRMEKQMTEEMNFKDAPVYANHFQKHLFSRGLLAVTCDNEKEYRDMMKDFLKLGFSIGKSVNASSWNEFCKYVYYDKKKQTLAASHRLPEGIDCINRYADFRKAASS